MYYVHVPACDNAARGATSMIINFITLLKNKVIQCWNEIASAADSMSQRGLAARAVCAQMPHFLQQVLLERHHPSANAHTKFAAHFPHKFCWISTSRTAIEQAVPCVVVPMPLGAALPQFRAPANLRPKRRARATRSSAPAATRSRPPR